MTPLSEPPVQPATATPDGALDACIETLVEVLPRVARVLKAQLRGGKLTPQNMFLLAIVQELDDLYGDGAQPGELARRACLSSAAITAAVDDLVAGGFCVRAHSEKDRRKVLVHVTPYGRTAQVEMRDETRALLRRILSGWDGEQAARLRQALEDLDATVQALLKQPAPSDRQSPAHVPG